MSLWRHIYFISQLHIIIFFITKVYTSSASILRQSLAFLPGHMYFLQYIVDDSFFSHLSWSSNAPSSVQFKYSVVLLSQCVPNPTLLTDCYFMIDCFLICEMEKVFISNLVRSENAEHFPKTFIYEYLKFICYSFVWVEYCVDVVVWTSILREDATQVCKTFHSFYVWSVEVERSKVSSINHQRFSLLNIWTILLYWCYIRDISSAY